jgi:hypothetical protein
LRLARDLEQPLDIALALGAVNDLATARGGQIDSVLENERRGILTSLGVAELAPVPLEPHRNAASPEVTGIAAR